MAMQLDVRMNGSKRSDGLEHEIPSEIVAAMETPTISPAITNIITSALKNASNNIPTRLLLEHRIFKYPIRA